jgi:hypothetical protein
MLADRRHLAVKVLVENIDDDLRLQAVESAVKPRKSDNQIAAFMDSA